MRAAEETGGPAIGGGRPGRAAAASGLMGGRNPAAGHLSCTGRARACERTCSACRRPTAYRDGPEKGKRILSRGQWGTERSRNLEHVAAGGGGVVVEARAAAAGAAVGEVVRDHHQRLPPLRHAAPRAAAAGDCLSPPTSLSSSCLVPVTAAVAVPDRDTDPVAITVAASSVVR